MTTPPQELSADSAYSSNCYSQMPILVEHRCGDPREIIINSSEVKAQENAAILNLFPGFRDSLEWNSDRKIIIMSCDSTAPAQETVGEVLAKINGKSVSAPGRMGE